MIWKGIFIQLSVCALQLGTKLIYSASELADPQMLQGLSTDSFTFHTWVSFLDQSSSANVFEVVDAQNQILIKVKRYLNQPVQVCFPSSCFSVPIDSSKFQWNFIAISTDQKTSNLCSKAWLESSLTCTSHYSEQVILTETSQIKSSESNELYEFQLFIKALAIDDLALTASTFLCHPVCSSCYGPSPTACNEFLPVVRLSQNFEVISVDYNEDSVPFRGKQFPSVDHLALTGWVKLGSSTAYYPEIIRLWTIE